jgi:hypothetical protein
MRDQLIAYLKTSAVTAAIRPIVVADELPWTKDGNPLYIKNFKRIYVDREQTAQESVFNTLDGGGVVNETTTVIAYLTVDAKNPLSNYDEIVNLMRDARNQVEPEARLDRIVNVNKTFEGDAQVTEFTFEFRKVIFN